MENVVPTNHESGDNVRLINLTGHDLIIRDEEDNTTKLQSYGRARVESDMALFHTEEYEGVKVDVLRVTEQRITGLPQPEPETYYIVSGIVASAARREDVVAPSRVKREEGGRVVECKALLNPVVMGTLDDEEDEE